MKWSVRRRDHRGFGGSGYHSRRSQLLEKNGTIIIRGTMSNKYFNQVINKTAKGLGNFDVVQTATKVSDEVRATMKTTDGKAIQGDIFGVVLKRK